MEPLIIDPSQGSQPPLPPVEVDPEGVLGCCIETLKRHAACNPMMVCGECKQIIKCFTDERPYRNYLTFCRSRNRQIRIAREGSFYMVVFRSYESYR